MQGITIPNQMVLQRGKLQNKTQIDTMSIRILPPTYSYIMEVCKLFLCSSKQIYALWAS